MKKRILTLIMATTLALGVTACGSSTPSGTQESSSNTESIVNEETNKETTQNSEDEESADTQEVMNELIYKVSKQTSSFVDWNEYNENSYIYGSVEFEDLVETREFEYDEAGNLLKEVFYGYNGVSLAMGELKPYQEDYEYDVNGNIVKKTIYNSDGSVSVWTEYIYNEVGNMIKAVENHDSYTTTHEYSYDEAGNKIKETYDPNQSEAFVLHEWLYDDAGNMVKETTYSDDGTVYLTEEYVYNDAGEVIKTISTREGVVSEYEPMAEEVSDTEYKYEYDEAGNVIKEMLCDANGTILRQTEYEYIEIVIPKQ